MADNTPIVGTHAPPPEDRKSEGVVLFDPTPPSLDIREAAEENTRSAAWVVAALFALVVAGGAYMVYTRVSASPIEVEFVQDQADEPRGPALSVTGGARQQGQAGASVAIEVRATGEGGAALPDTLIHFRVTQGGGLLELDAAQTDSSGVARTVLHLPRRAGLVAVAVDIAGTAAATSITIDALAGVPTTMTATAGDGQSAEVGELLPVRLAVRVLDADGNAVSGSDVRFEVLAGGGIAAPSRARTDSLGIASALWRLGPEAGTQRLAASSTVLGSAVSFTATARGRPRAADGTPLPVEAGPVSVHPRDLVVGGSHTCRLRAGIPACRGANDRGQHGSEAVNGFRALAAGVSHMCGLDGEGVARCWGANDGGQLGDGSRTDRSEPIAVRTDLRFSSLTAGASHTCGLAGGGIPLCWGQNLSGQLGDGSRNDSRFPRAVGGGLTFRSLAAGWNHTCGLTENGNAFCWGLNGDGQLGDNSRLDRLVPTLVRGAVESITAGSAHTCGISENQVLCWGDNRFGQLGDGSTESKPQPSAVSGLPSRPTLLVAGAVHTCALVAGGAAFCWGQNLRGQLGDGTTTNRSTPVAVSGGIRFSTLEAGGALTCGIATDRTQYCWGLNQNGQLGDGTRQNRSAPTAVRNQ